MEGESGDVQGCTQCGTTPTQEAGTQDQSGECDESTKIHVPEQDELVNGNEEAESTQLLSDTTGGDQSDINIQHDVCTSDIEEIVRESQGDGDCLPLCPQPEQKQTNLPYSTVPSDISTTHNRAPGPCWYCLRSFDFEERPQAPSQQDPDPLSPTPSGGQKVTYQTDPRPHFGVAYSSHSTPLPLWGSEGPCWGLRNQDMPNQTYACPHCHLGLTPDTLRWHEEKCLLFDRLKDTANK